MKIYTNKFSSEGATVEEKVENIESFLSQFSNNIIDVLTSRANFADNFDAIVKTLEIQGSGEYIISTNNSQILGGLILRASNGAVVSSYNTFVQGSDVKLTVNLLEEVSTQLTVVVFLS